MSSLPITSAFNDGYIAGLYESFLRDPASVDSSWRQFFSVAQSIAGAGSAASGVATDAAYLRKVAGAAGLVQAIRQYGHLDVQLDPLGSPPLSAAELKPEFHGISNDDLQTIPGAALGFAGDATAAAAVARLRQIYSSTIGFEFEHIEEDTERDWFRRAIESGEMRRTLTADEKKRAAAPPYGGGRSRAVPGARVPGLQALLDRGHRCARSDARRGDRWRGARGRARGRDRRWRIGGVSTCSRTFSRSRWRTSSGTSRASTASSPTPNDTGDVKYHLGARTVRPRVDGGERGARRRSCPNPSHLEFVNPVVEGVHARASAGAAGHAGVRDEASVLPMLHARRRGVSRRRRRGRNLQPVAPARVPHGRHAARHRRTIRSGSPPIRATAARRYYASDLAKGFEMPIIHVNGDDAEACVTAVRARASRTARGSGRTSSSTSWATAATGTTRRTSRRTRSRCCTTAITAHPTPREVWGARLVARACSRPTAQSGSTPRCKRRFESRPNASQSRTTSAGGDRANAAPRAAADLGGRSRRASGATRLARLNERCSRGRPTSTPLPKLAKQLERRRAAIGDAGGHRLGARGSAGVRVPAHPGRVGAPHGPGRRARHVLAPAGGAARPRERQRRTRRCSTSPARPGSSRSTTRR